jgi:hypothetical protein
MALGDEEFEALIRDFFAQLGPRPCGEAEIARALGYPWERPAGSYLLRGGAVEPLGAMEPSARKRAVGRFTAPGRGRLPVLSIGSNAAPSVAERKFAHFEDEEDRAVLALSGHLHDFDVGVAPQPALYGSLPATLFPSPGTAVRATLLWVTPAQFTQLAWSEISYRLGRLRTRFEVDENGPGYDEVLVFISRFGAFCPDGEPVALAAIPARARVAPELSQEQLLAAAARLALGPTAAAETLVRAIFERPAELVPELVASVHKAALPFSSDRWTWFGSTRA